MIENVPEIWRAGGHVLVAIVALSTLAWMLLIQKSYELLLARRQVAGQGEVRLEQGADRIVEPVAHFLAESRDRKPRTMDKVLDPLLNAAGVRLERHLGTIAALAAVLPLLGLLGTVMGMVDTFDVITVHGTGEPRLMAHGIRRALVTTEAGLLMALPILLVHRYLSSQAGKIEGEMRLLAHRWARERRET